jgi:glycosyltransferase involved in cell wall biosynthesis
MHYLLDGLPLTRTKTGIGHYTFELAVQLARLVPNDRVELVSPTPYPRETIGAEESSLPPNLLFETVPANLVERRWFSIGLPRYIKRKNTALFHGTNFEVPLRRSCPSVVTIHDLSLLSFPETHVRRRVWRSRLKLPLMARTATMVITPSEQIRSEVCERFNLDRGRVVRVSEAPRAVFSPASAEEIELMRQRLGVQCPFLLAVGTIEPRKNLISLLRAFAHVKETYQGAMQLTITGAKGWRYGPFFDEIEHLKIGESVLLTDYVSESELKALYSACEAFVYPSFYEGFGLPPLEALACGAPVIVNQLDCLREVLGDAALFVDKLDPGSLADSIKWLLGNDEVRMRFKSLGPRRARLFTWEKTATSTLEVYADAIARFSRESRVERIEQS